MIGVTVGTLAAAALLPLTGAPPAGSSELHPRWSPSGRYLSLERDDGRGRVIEIYAPGGRLVETIAPRPAAAGDDLLEREPAAASFSAWLTWAPDERRFAFVSNGGAGVYDLYLGTLAAVDLAAWACDPGEPVPAPAGAGSVPSRAAGPGSGPRSGGACVVWRDAGSGGSGRPPAVSVTHLTSDAAADGQVAWSPVGDRLAFVSGRTDAGDLYLLDLATDRIIRLTADGRSVLHPDWAPDGRRLAFAAGSGDDHDICVIGDVDRPAETRRCIVSWAFDDLRPKWSPDGRRLAFYSSYDADGEPAVWSLFAVAADGSDPAKGEGLLARRLDTGVVPDLAVGPAWTPDGRRIVYVKRVDRDFNPLFAVDVEGGTVRRLDTGHAIHHDVALARDGRIAVRAQVARWDRVLVGRLDELLAAGTPVPGAGR